MQICLISAIHRNSIFQIFFDVVNLANVSASRQTPKYRHQVSGLHNVCNEANLESSSVSVADLLYQF